MQLNLQNIFAAGIMVMLNGNNMGKKKRFERKNDMKNVNWEITETENRVFSSARHENRSGKGRETNAKVKESKECENKSNIE